MTSYALITGASAGLGAEFARQLAAAGYNLVLVARRVDKLEELAAQIHEAHGVDVVVMAADMTDATAPANLRSLVEQQGLQVDYLVNNAGSAGPDLIRTRDWPANENYLRLMMTSNSAMCHEFIPAMVERGFGRVINVASVAGQITVNGDYSYGPTKAYLIALSKGLATSFKAEGVNVMALCPGFTHTQFHESEKLSAMKKSTPGFIWYDASVVVREALKAIEKGRTEYTSGRLYRVLIPILRRRWSRALVSLLGVRL